jgi:hypothetical protein
MPLTVSVGTYYGTVLRRQGKAAGLVPSGGFAVIDLGCIAEETEDLFRTTLAPKALSRPAAVIAHF